RSHQTSTAVRAGCCLDQHCSVQRTPRLTDKSRARTSLDNCCDEAELQISDAPQDCTAPAEAALQPMTAPATTPHTRAKSLPQTDNRRENRESRERCS